MDEKGMKGVEGSNACDFGYFGVNRLGRRVGEGNTISFV
jgi:hypothetical protein